MHKNTGFTLVETVMVIIIAGLLAIYALPRFFSESSFENRGFYEEVINAVRYAQQLAVAINCNTQVTLTNTDYTVTMADDPANCNAGPFGTPAPDPVTGQLGFTGSNDSVTITRSANSFTFNALGVASTAVIVTVGGRSFTVHADTGYIE